MRQLGSLRVCGGALQDRPSRSRVQEVAMSVQEGLLKGLSRTDLFRRKVLLRAAIPHIGAAVMVRVALRHAASSGLQVCSACPCRRLPPRLHVAYHSPSAGCGIQCPSCWLRHSVHAFRTKHRRRATLDLEAQAW